MRKKEIVVIILLIFGFFTLTFLKGNLVLSSGEGQPGSRCESDSDCRFDLKCYYNTCLAQPFAPCETSADCAGEATHLMGCFDKGDGKKCYGRHAYPCGDIREDPVCAPGFHCDISNPGYHYCEGDEEEIFVDLKANGSDSPIYLYFQDYVNLSWTSGNAFSCFASGDWSGEKPLNGEEKLKLDKVKIYNFTIACSDESKTREASDSVQIKVLPRQPFVITKGVVVTY